MKNKLLWLTVLPLSLQLVGCATPKNPDDPYEAYNRKMFAFNTALDKAVLRPVARGYNTVVPQKAQAHVTYFFYNLDAVPTVANDILQLNPIYAVRDTSRFLINSTVGIFGLFDVASHINLPYHHNDLGLTFAHYGMDRSPYFVIPFLGASTIRDAGAEVGNTYMSVWPYVQPTYLSWGLYGLEKVHYRAALLPADQLVDSAFDPYLFVRDAYLQNRQKSVDTVTQGSAHESGTSANHDKDDTFVADETEDKKSATTSSSGDHDTFVPA